MTVTYFASRDTARSQATDEDRAMAHDSIAAVDTFEKAQHELVAYMQHEVEWLLGRSYRSAVSVRRAADILEAVDKVKCGMPRPDENTSWSKSEVVAAGLVWQIVRTDTDQ